MPETVQSVLIHFGTAVIIAVLTVQLSLRKFCSQKWWEKKAEVYSDIFKSLSNMKNYAKEFMDSLAGERISEQRSKIQEDRWQKSKDRVQQIIDIGTFIISEDVNKHLAVFSKELEAIHHRNTDIYEMVESELELLQRSIDEIRECAKQDLKRDPWWKWTF